MAKFYSKAKSNYGSLSGTIIIWPIEIPSTNPTNVDNVNILPSGYLRCDGAKYSALDYPNLAAVCGTGTNCKFLKRDENNDPLTVLTDQEFVVPDLGSKYPRPTPGASAGQYNNILTKAQSGLYVKRSGMGIEATSNVGSVATETYTGKFNIPSQEIDIKGKPAWTWGTASNTDSESVDQTAIHPHMHFSTTSRVRVKPKNAPVNGQDLASSINSFQTASTINIDDWLNATNEDMFIIPRNQIITMIELEKNIIQFYNEHLNDKSKYRKSRSNQPKSNTKRQDPKNHNGYLGSIKEAKNFLENIYNKS